MYKVKLRITHKIYDLADYTFSYYSNAGYFRTAQIDEIKAGVNNVIPSIICTDYPADKPNGLADDTVSISTLSRIIIKDDSYNGDATAFNTAMANVKLIAELATPIEIDLTDASDIVALVGVNNVWSDTGDIEVQYITSQAEDTIKVVKAEVSNTDINVLKNVDITNPIDGQALIYDGTNQKWKNSTSALIENNLTAIISLGWTVRAKSFVENNICYIDILAGTPNNGFSEDAAVWSGAPIPKSGYSASLIGLCDGNFYRFYVDPETGYIHSRNPISASQKEIVVFGSYFCE